MNVTQEAIDLIKHFEGCRLTAYKCPAGVWTIGVGSTGPHVREGMTITEKQAEDILREDLARFEAGVWALVGSIAQYKFNALVCLAFNIGLSALAKSTLLTKWRAGDNQGAADEFLRWNKAKGKALAGLTRRRKCERLMFLGLDWRKHA